MFCIKCGSQLNKGSAFCSRCGARVSLVTEPVATAAAPPQPTGDVSPKSRLATSLLAWFLGGLGVHRFYTGKIGTAVIVLLLGILSGICWVGGFFGGLASGTGEPFWALMVIAGILYFGVWVWKTVDFIIAVTGSFKDSLGKPIKRW